VHSIVATLRLIVRFKTILPPSPTCPMIFILKLAQLSIGSIMKVISVRLPSCCGTACVHPYEDVFTDCRTVPSSLSPFLYLFLCLSLSVYPVPVTFPLSLLLWFSPCASSRPEYLLLTLSGCLSPTISSSMSLLLSPFSVSVFPSILLSLCASSLLSLPLCHSPICLFYNFSH
jgi:hypothetical protein